MVNLCKYQTCMVFLASSTVRQRWDFLDHTVDCSKTLKIITWTVPGSPSNLNGRYVPSRGDRVVIAIRDVGMVLSNIPLVGCRRPNTRVLLIWMDWIVIISNVQSKSFWVDVTVAEKDFRTVSNASCDIECLNPVTSSEVGTVWNLAKKEKKRTFGTYEEPQKPVSPKYQECRRKLLRNLERWHSLPLTIPRQLGRGTIRTLQNVSCTFIGKVKSPEEVSSQGNIALTIVHTPQIMKTLLTSDPMVAACFIPTTQTFQAMKKRATIANVK